MKKLLLSLGTATAVIAPAASVIACGNAPTYTIKVDNATSMNYLVSIKDTLSSQPGIYGDLIWDIKTQGSQVLNAVFGDGNGTHMLPGISADDNKKNIYNGLDKFLYHLVGAIDRDTDMHIVSTVDGHDGLTFDEAYFDKNNNERVQHIVDMSDEILAAFANVSIFGDSIVAGDSTKDGTLTNDSTFRDVTTTDIENSVKVFNKTA